MAAGTLHAAGHSARQTMLYLQGVTVSFDGFKALNELSLVIDKGELRTIIGPNGAGKTTMLDVITGRSRPDQGRVLFNGGSDLTKLDEATIVDGASSFRLFWSILLPLLQPAILTIVVTSTVTIFNRQLVSGITSGAIKG